MRGLPQRGIDLPDAAVHMMLQYLGFYIWGLTLCR